MDDCPFARLPSELRNEIWKLALTRPEAIEVRGTGNNRNRLPFEIYLEPLPFRIVTTAEPADKHPLALLGTCKQIKHECGSLFYIHNSFILRSTRARTGGRNSQPPAIQLLHGFTTHIGSANTDALCNVTICPDVRLGAYNPLNVYNPAAEQHYKDADFRRMLLRTLWWMEQYDVRSPHWNLKATIYLQLDGCDSLEWHFWPGKGKQSLMEEALRVQLLPHHGLFSDTLHRWVLLLGSIGQEAWSGEEDRPGCWAEYWNFQSFERRHVEAMASEMGILTMGSSSRR